MISLFAGLTSQSIDIFIPDSASTTGGGKTGLVFNSAGLTAYYRKGAAGSPTAVTLATLANAQAAWSSGGFVEVDATNMPGVYRLDLPNAVIDTAGLVHLELKGASGMAPVLVRVDCRALPSDLRQSLGVAVNSSGGRPEVNTTHAAGTAWNSGAIQAATVAASALNGKGDWSTAGQVSSLAINTRANLQIPIEIETPDTGTQVWKIRLHLFDVEGNMEAPDSTPTVTLTNAAGTSRAARLSVASNPSTGVYTWDYTASAGDAEEQLVWLFTVTEGGLTRTYPATSYVVEETAYRFSSSDRATLNAAATAAALTALSNKIGTPAGASVAADMAAAKAVLDAVVADTNELQTDWANGGRLDLLVDAALAAAVLSRQILGNKHVVTNNNNGTYTIQIRDDSDTTTVRTIIYTPATGARTAS